MFALMQRVRREERCQAHVCMVNGSGLSDIALLVFQNIVINVVSGPLLRLSNHAGEHQNECCARVIMSPYQTDREQAVLAVWFEEK